MTYSDLSALISLNLALLPSSINWSLYLNRNCNQSNKNKSKCLTAKPQIPCAYLRGGSNKATFIIESNLPCPGLLRDGVLKRINETPDPIQIDGMGGSRVITSKIAIIAPSGCEDADVDYAFRQVGLDTDIVKHGGNCGNISGVSIKDFLVLENSKLTDVF